MKIYNKIHLPFYDVWLPLPEGYSVKIKQRHGRKWVECRHPGTPPVTLSVPFTTDYADKEMLGYHANEIIKTLRLRS